MPIQRKNEWISKKSEWTKYHAFINCQDFRLTANRSNLDNTPADFMEKVEKTVRKIFENKIKSSRQFIKYDEELFRQSLVRKIENEENDFKRRKKAALIKKGVVYNSILLLEPRQEGGVLNLFLQLQILKPDLFNFKVIDYDTNFGYDLLVTQDTSLNLNQASMKFIELKYELKRDFTHSFKRLAAIICWDTKLSNDELVIDPVDKKRKFRITPKSDTQDYKKYMLISDTSSYNIEVIVLKDYLKDKLNLDFRPVADFN